MAFTQPCFIRKSGKDNFPLIVELEKMGYKREYMNWRNNIEGSNIVCEHQAWHCTDSDNKPPAIDCGANEKLFMAIAAMRDDTDLHQWFVYTMTHKSGSITHKKGELWFNDCIHTVPKMAPTRKATVNELLAYFKSRL